MKDTIKSPSIDTGIDITKMHGHMDIYLTNVKTGKIEEVHEDNMMTNAIQEYFRNCGFLNFPNVNQNSMVLELLGGVIGLNDEIDENAAIIRVPAGNKMIFNGSVGAINNGNPTELGSYSETESGWQQDGSYVQTYDFSTSQANGTISCVCLTGRAHGYSGEGNATSLTVTASKANDYSLQGSITTYTIPGRPFHYNLQDSSVYTLIFEDVEEEGQGGETVTVRKAYLRKYRLPLSKVNLKGTQTECVLLSEQEITIDEEMQNAEYFSYQDVGGDLYIWSASSRYWSKWDDGFTQYLWRLTTNGTLTRQTITNTSGNPDLYGFNEAFIDGNYIFFVNIGPNGIIDTTVIYIYNRSNGSISTIDNPYGQVYRVTSGWSIGTHTANWRLKSRSGDGRIVVGGKDFCYIVDAVLEEVYITNAGAIPEEYFNKSQNGLIIGAPINARIMRDQAYIASINNLDNPVVKTSEKTMKVVYRITFDEQ